MKKVIVLLLLVITLTGCMTTKSFESDDIDKLIIKYLKVDTYLVNTSSNGYKYYMPNGVRVIDSNDYNEKLYYKGYNYYMYVDAVSYYYKTDVEYVENNSLYYSKKLNYNDKSGYLEIEKLEELYKVDFVYNYSKIETYVDYNNLKQTLINICYILNSIKFNDPITESTVGEEKKNLTEESYDFYTPRNEGHFIDYINKYDGYQSDTEDTTDNNIGNEESE